MLHSSKKTHEGHVLTADWDDAGGTADASHPETEEHTVFLLYTPGTETTGIDVRFRMANPEGVFGDFADVDGAGVVTLWPVRTIAKPGAATMYVFEIGKRNAGALQVAVQTTGAIGGTPGNVDVWIQGVGAGF